MFTRAKYEVSDVFYIHEEAAVLPDLGPDPQTAACELPFCLGTCEECEEYKAYGVLVDLAHRSCKVQQAHELGDADPDSVICDCQLCSKDLEIVSDEEE